VLQIHIALQEALLQTSWPKRSKLINKEKGRYLDGKILIEFKISISRLALTPSWGLKTKLKCILN